MLGSYDVTLFEVLDTAIVNVKQQLQEKEWEYTDDSETEHLKHHLDYLMGCKSRGEVLLPRF